MSEYEPIIGMEVHVELLTASKMFCRCSADIFGEPPNTHTCPVCTGMPGSLPVINRRAVELTIMTGLALNCKIAEYTFWERKSYWYPDLPKGYQISQYQVPLTYDGWLDIEVDGQVKRIRIRRAHLEEDTGKLMHVNGVSLVDYNRSGIPLLEIVTEPDFRSAQEAFAYLTKLRQIVRYLGVSTGDMEKGAMRCEANVSVRPVGSDEMGVKVEIKNLNSIRAVRLALEYEIERQVRALQAGEPIEQVTMGWDEDAGRTVVQRTKEYAHDYRYFPEPDLPPLVVSREWVEEIRARMPELPDARRKRFMEQYELSDYDAGVLTAERAVADYYEACVQAGQPDIEPKAIANWVTGELFRLMKAHDQDVEQIAVRPEHLVELLRLVERGAISRNVAKTVFEEMFSTGKDASTIVQERGLTQISDEDRLRAIVVQVLEENPQPVADYLGGKQGAIGFLVGQVMKATRGQANPKVVNKLLRAMLEERRAAEEA